MESSGWYATWMSDKSIVQFHCEGCQDWFWRSGMPGGHLLYEQFRLNGRTLIDPKTITGLCKRCASKVVVSSHLRSDGRWSVHQLTAFEMSFRATADHARVLNLSEAVRCETDMDDPVVFYRQIERRAAKYAVEDISSRRPGMMSARSAETFFWDCFRMTCHQLFEHGRTMPMTERWRAFVSNFLRSGRIRQEDLERVDVDRLIGYARRAAEEIASENIFLEYARRVLTLLD